MITTDLVATFFLFAWFLRSKSIGKTVSSVSLAQRVRFLVAPKRLYKSTCPSVRPSVRPYVILSLLGLLEATYAVHTALFRWVQSII